MIEQLRPGVHRIEVPFQGASLVSSTNCYLVADDEGGLHLIDPGSPQEVSDRALRSALAELGHELGDVRTVLATHAHHDHVGWATRAPAGVRLGVGRRETATLARPFSVRVTDALLERWGVPRAERPELREPPGAAAFSTLVPDLLLDDGDVLPVPGRRIRVVGTPGHTAGSVAFVVDDGLLLAGDAVLPGVNPGLGMGGFDEGEDVIGLGLASLARLAGLERRSSGGVAASALLVGPGHGAPFTGLAARCDALTARHLARSDEVARLARSGVRTVWQVAERIAWSGGWDAVRGYLRISALWQTELHLRRIAVLGC